MVLVCEHITDTVRSSVICGARTHAELPPVDLKSTPLSHSGKMTLVGKAADFVLTIHNMQCQSHTLAVL